MGHDRILKVDGADPLAARFDQVLGPVSDLHVTVAVDVGDIAGTEPAILIKAGPGRLIILKITCEKQSVPDFRRV